MYCDSPTDIRIARQTGCEGIEIVTAKPYGHMRSVFVVEGLLPELEGLRRFGLSLLQDIGRQRPGDCEPLLPEL
jgi:hypothetical protein